MKETLTQLVAAVFVLIRIVTKAIIFIPNVLEIQTVPQYPTVQHVIGLGIETYPNSCDTSITFKQCQGLCNSLTPPSCHLVVELPDATNNTATTNYIYHESNIDTNSKALSSYNANINNTTIHQSPVDPDRKQQAKHSASEVIFMLSINFVRLVIVVIAYQQLLHNGYVIVESFYYKYIRQLKLLIWNRPYPLESGRGPEDVENQQHPSSNIVNFQIFKRIFQFVYGKCVCANNNANDKQNNSNKTNDNHTNPRNKQYTLIENVLQNDSPKDLTSGIRFTRAPKESVGENVNKTHNLYHQQHQQMTYSQLYQQYNDCNHYYQCYYHQNPHNQYHQNPCQRCFYQQQVNRKLVSKDQHHYGHHQHHDYRPTTAHSRPKKRNTDPKTCNMRNCRVNPIVTLSSMMCCWKTSGSGRKRRKRRTNIHLDKCNSNCNLLVWSRSFIYTCCHCECLFQYLHLHCYHNSDCGMLFSCCCICCCCCCCCCCYCCCCCCYCFCCYCCCYCCCYSICEINSNITSKQSKQHPRNYNLKISSKQHKAKIINITKDISGAVSRQPRRKWYIGTSQHDDSVDDNATNLLQSLNAVKAITSALQSRNYKRKLKKNLVWLFIGLVWLEGPKFINCSISHNNQNGVTSLSGGNETANKIGSNQNGNNDNSSGNNGSGNSRNGGRANSGTTNTNGPGPTPRPHAVENQGQLFKKDNLFKTTNSLTEGYSGGPERLHHTIGSYSNQGFMQNTLGGQQTQEQQQQPLLETKWQHHHHRSVSERGVPNQREPYVISRSGYTPERQTTRIFEFFESEKVDRARSDLIRLESIKRQILTKLGLTEKPNVTHPLPKQFIWDTIYRADGIRSVSDFDFNDNHRTQEHMRLTSAVLEPPPLTRHHYPSNMNLVPDRDEVYADHLKNLQDIDHSFSETTKNMPSTGNDILSGNWKLFNLSAEQLREHDEIHVLSKYERRHRMQDKPRPVHVNKKSAAQNKNRYNEPDYFEGDDFFGSTQEIITFAEKGKIYKKHRLVEFSPPSNKIPKQRLQIRNAEIHIRIEKIGPHSGHFEHRHTHRNRHVSSREPNLKIWIFQVVGNDFSSKGFDQMATLCTSLTVDHNVLGWQKLDITKTVQYWYTKHQKEKLRLLIDCTGCGSRYVLHLFDRKYQHSVIPSHHDANVKFNKHNDTIVKSDLPDRDQSQRYYYHYRQYNRHRYRRKNQPGLNKHHSPDRFNSTPFNNGSQDMKPRQSPPHLQATKMKHRKSREIKVNNGVNKERLEGVSYEVGADYPLEDRLNPNRPFLVLHTEPTRARRVRRRAVDCAGAIHGQCCKESFYVSFKALGWDDWIIAPRGYFANYCRGDCTGPYRTPDTFQTFHAHFIEEYRKMGLLNGMKPCCAPVKFSSMSLIYYGDDGIIKRDLPKMVVDECGCP